MKILKFGGSSVAHAENISKVIKIIEESIGDDKAIVVVSACGKTTNQILELPDLALNDPQQALDLITTIIENHRIYAQDLLSTLQQREYKAILEHADNVLRKIVNGISLIEEVTPRAKDYLASIGEQLSSHLLAYALQEAGHVAEQMDARTFLIAIPPYENGIVQRQKSYSLIQEQFSEKAGFGSGIRVVPGFIASTPEGHTITLGRGGSDYTAALIGAALSVSCIEIWTDVDGLMTADPGSVPRAFCQEQVTYEEAMELSHFGARVIYPPTIQPAIESAIPIFIKNTFNPSWPGSRIHHTVTERRTVTGITSISEVALIRLQGSGMVGVTGISGRVFGALANKGVSAILITQASSEHTICFAVLPTLADAAVTVLKEEFEFELYRRHIDEPIVEDSLSIVSIVGEQMRHTTGIAARAFSALSANGVNVVAIAQGSSERNISAVIPQHGEKKALRALHEEFFFPERRFINVFLCGTGLIGTALLKQIAEHTEALSTEHHHDIRIIGVTNSRFMHMDESGIAVESINNILESEGVTADYPLFLERMASSTVPNKVFVDCTASDQVSLTYDQILGESVHIVTPNKRAQTSSSEQYRRLQETAVKKGVMLLWETSVGAGLPIINTLNDLLRSGDTIIRIDAVLSGTLSYLFNSFDGSIPFSALVKNARERGFTEPDPRDDLNGMDVARKILILAREAGKHLEISDISVENLVPESCREADTVDEFFELLEQEDQHFASLLESARQENKHLCYIACFENGAASVSLQAIDAEHPFFNLSGSDNIVSFRSHRYEERPLVIKGPGAGAEVTAAGVFADIVRLGNVRQ